MKRLTFAALVGALIVPGVAAAQPFPSKAVRIVVTSGPGGSSDLNARLIAPKLSEIWGQPVLVENRPGGSFIIGTEHVAKSPPDGHTLLVTITNLAQNVATRKNLPYDTFRDIAPITRIHLQQLFFVVDAKLPARTLAEFVELARASPGKFNFASYGSISTAHLLLAKLNHDAKLDIVHVAYSGMAAAVRALLAGDASVAAVDLTNARTDLASGRWRVLATTGGKRSPHLPEAPTFEESGIPGFAVDIWAALFAPGGTPEPILNKIAADFAKVLEQPDVQGWYKSAGVEPVANTPTQFRELLKQDVDYWTNLVQTTKIKLD
jgi:tripartite-type tricarboxylate transporter receptor subunit TctC